MKKIIPTFLLAVLASSSLLLAANENNLEETSLLENTSAPISYLGVTPKLMMNPSTLEEGIKAIGEALGRVGKKGFAAEKTAVEGAGAGRGEVVNAISSSSSHQVLRLRGGGPKKFQPTGRLKSTGDTSDEEDVDLDLESTDTPRINEQVNIQFKNKINNIDEVSERDVAKIERDIEEAKQAFKEKRGGENSYLWDRIAAKLEQSRESWNKVNELINKGRTEKTLLWRKAAEESEASAEGIRQAVHAYISGNEKEAQQLEKENRRGYYLSDASTWTLKSEEALENAAQMQGEKQDFWRDLAEQYKVAADYERRASEAHLADKESERGSWVWAGRSAHSSAGYQAKACEAEEAGQTMLAAGYGEASLISQRAADQYKQAALAYGAGKENEGDSWHRAGESLRKKADCQAKACEVEGAGKITLAAGYREAVLTYQKAADQLKVSAEKKAKGNEDEGISWERAGLSLQAKADYQVKAIEAEEAGKAQLAAGYREAAAIYQKAADQYKQAVLACATGKVDDGDSWANEGKSLQSQADYQVKASEAQEVGKTTLAAGYREVATIYQKAVDQYKQVALASVAEKEYERISWFDAGESLQMMAGYQAKACEAEEAGKTMLAAGYGKVAVTSQRAADQYKQAALVFAKGKESEGHSWYAEGKSLQNKADYQVKACEAQEAGKTMLAAGYGEASVTSQRAADQYKQAALACGAGKENEGVSWNWEGTSLQAKADYQAKACEAEESGKTMLAAGYGKAAVTSQRAADQYKQAALTYVEGKKNEGASWNWEGASLLSKADYQVKACEAEEAGKTMLAAGYGKVAVTSQRAADQYKQAALVFAKGKESEGHSWYAEGKSLQNKADYQVKACEAQESGKTMFAAGYGEAAVTSQRAADQYKQAALVFAKEKGNEGNSWYAEGKSLQAKADYQVKACEAEDIGKTTLAAGYRKAVEISQRAADQAVLAQLDCRKGKHQYDRVSQLWEAVDTTMEKAHAIAKRTEDAVSVGIINIEDDFNQSVEKEGLLEQESIARITEQSQVIADYQEKASQAQRAGKKQVATDYLEAVATLKKAVNQWELSAKRYAAGIEGEGNSLFEAGKSFQMMADYQVKAIKAQEAGKTQLVAGYQEAAAISQKAVGQWKLSVKKRAEGAESEGDSLFEAGKSFQSIADYTAKACEAEAAGKRTLVAGYREAARTSQEAVDQSKLSAKRKAEGKECEGGCCLYAAKSLQSKAIYQAKASEVKDIGATTLAASYREAATTSQQAVDKLKLSLQRRVQDKERESVGLANAGVSFQVVADYQAKASEAEEVGKTALAVGYREAAVTSKKATDYYEQAASVSVEEKESEMKSWFFAAKSLQAKAAYQAKAYEVEETGKFMLAASYRKAAEASQNAADQLKLSAQRRAVGKEGEGISLAESGKSLQLQADNEAKLAERVEKDGVVNPLPLSKKPRVRGCMRTKPWVEYAKMKFVRPSSSAASLLNSSQLPQNLSSLSTATAIASASRMPNTLSSKASSSSASSSVAATVKRASQVCSVESKTVLPRAKKACMQAKSSAEGQSSSAAEVVAKDCSDGDAKASLYLTDAERQYYNEVSEPVADVRITEVRERALQALKQAAFAKAINEKSQQTEDDICFRMRSTTFHYIIDVRNNNWNRVAEKAEQASESWLKVGEALGEGNAEKALQWRSVAELLEDSIKAYKGYQESGLPSFIRLPRAHFRNLLSNKFFSSSLADLSSSAARSFAKSNEATAQGNLIMAEFWHKSAVQNQEAAEYFSQLTKVTETKKIAEEKGVEDKAQYVKCCANSLELAAEASEKAMQAVTQGNQGLAALWQETVSRYQKSSEDYRQITVIANKEQASSQEELNKKELNKEEHDEDEAYDDEEEEPTEEESILQKQSISMKVSADQLKSAALALEKVEQATTQGNSTLGELWQKTAAEYQLLAEDVLHDSNFFVGNYEGNHYFYPSNIDLLRSPTSLSSADLLRLAASVLEKAEQAATQGKSALAVLWKKAASQYQEVAKINNKSDDYERCMMISAYHFSSTAMALEKVLQFTAQGNSTLTALWQKTADQHQTAAKCYRQAAAATNDKKLSDFRRASIAAALSADQLELSITALEKVREEGEAVEETTGKLSSSKEKSVPKKNRENNQYYAFGFTEIETEGERFLRAMFNL